ncbi:hypothetical protein AY600_18480 [Phormidium willei BDU 130791]|nr:hypothetical protein AY600_18480 [Phormidium willei BDU 130791]
MAKIISLLELLLICLGGVLIVHSPDRRLSESLALGIHLGLIALSFSFQFSFLLGVPQLSFFWESLLVILSVWLIFRQKNTLKVARAALIRLGKKYRLLFIFSGIPIAYLGLKALVIAQQSHDVVGYGLSRVWIFQQQKTLLLDKVCQVHQAIFPVGTDILAHLFLRWNTDWGAGFFNFLAYLSILLGNYALARKYVSEKLAIAITLAIASLPQIMFQGWIAKNNIFTASATIFCLLILDRLFTSPTSANLFLLILGLFFGVAAKTTFLAIALPLLILYGIPLIQKYGLKIWIREIRKNWRFWLAGTVPLLVMSQLWLFIHNDQAWGMWSGPRFFVEFHKNQNGLRGGLANLVRFILEFIDSTPLPRDWVDNRFDPSIFAHIEQAYYQFLYPVFGEAGLQPGERFGFALIPFQAVAGFGLLGLILILPSILISLWTPPKFSKRLAGTLISFLLIFCLTSTWSQYKIRMLSPLFAASGACIAQCLSRITRSRRQESLIFSIITLISILNLFYISLYDWDAKILRTYNPRRWNLEASIWVQSDWGRDRLYPAKNYHGDERLKILADFFPEGSRVGFFTEDSTRLHYYFLHIPQVEFQSICMDDPSRRSFPEQTFDTLEDAMLTLSTPLDYVLCVGEQCQTPGNQLQERFYFPSEKETLFIFEVLPTSPSE